jgi:hypothetical protein
MRFVAALLTVLCLGACSTTTPSDSEQGLVDQAGWGRHQQVMRDVGAILQGMNQAREQTERFANQSQ